MWVWGGNPKNIRHPSSPPHDSFTSRFHHNFAFSQLLQPPMDFRRCHKGVVVFFSVLFLGVRTRLCRKEIHLCPPLPQSKRERASARERESHRGPAQNAGVGKQHYTAAAAWETEHKRPSLFRGATHSPPPAPTHSSTRAGARLLFSSLTRVRLVASGCVAPPPRRFSLAGNGYHSPPGSALHGRRHHGRQRGQAGRECKRVSWARIRGPEARSRGEKRGRNPPLAASPRRTADVLAPLGAAALAATHVAPIGAAAAWLGQAWGTSRAPGQRGGREGKGTHSALALFASSSHTPPTPPTHHSDVASWITWFCSLKGNEFFCEVRRGVVAGGRRRRCFYFSTLPSHLLSSPHHHTGRRRLHPGRLQPVRPGRLRPLLRPRAGPDFGRRPPSPRDQWPWRRARPRCPGRRPHRRTARPRGIGRRSPVRPHPRALDCDGTWPGGSLGEAQVG